MQETETLLEILNNCLNCAYFDFYKQVEDVDMTNEMMAKFLMQKTTYDDIFSSRGLKDNPVIYKKILILYLSLKVYISELYNKENCLQLKTNDEVLNKLDDVFSSSELIYNFINMDNYRNKIVREGIRLVLDPSQVRDYKQQENIKTEKKIFKILHLLPMLMLDLSINKDADQKDIIMNDVIEIYQFELSKTLDRLYQIKKEMLSIVMNSVEEGLEESEIEELIQNKFADEVNFYSDSVKMMETVFKETWKKIQEKCKTKEELYNLVGIIIGNVYTNLSIAEEITPFDKKIKSFFELTIGDRNVYIDAILKNENFCFALLDLFLEHNSLETTKEDRLIKEERLRQKGPRYVKILQKYDTFYKDK